MSDFLTLLPSREDGQTEGRVWRSKRLQVASGTSSQVSTRRGTTVELDGDSGSGVCLIARQC